MVVQAGATRPGPSPACWPTTPATTRGPSLPEAAPADHDTGSLVALGTSVLVTTRRLGYVMAYDVGGRPWSVLPPDDVEPRLDGVSVSTDGDDVFLCGTDPSAVDDGDTPSFVVVDAWDGTSWTRLPPSRQVGCVGHWTGERLVNADIQTATGLDGNPPFGGRLDPATGRVVLAPGRTRPRVAPAGVDQRQRGRRAADRRLGVRLRRPRRHRGRRSGARTPRSTAQTGAVFADGRLRRRRRP